MYSTTNSTYGSNYYHPPPPPPRYGNSTPKPQKPSIYSKTHEIIPTGFSHLANTCYMASILQILFLILPENMKISEGNITKLFFQLKTTKQNYQYKQFKNQLSKLIPFVNGLQQDAHQFLTYFLNRLSLQNLIGNQQQKLKYGQLDYNQNETIPKNYQIFSKLMNKIQNSPITNLFSGSLLTQFKCSENNKHTKHKFQKYLCLSLYFPPPTKSPFNNHWSTWKTIESQSEIPLTQLLKNNLQKPQTIQIYCQTCKKNKSFTKTTSIYDAPKYFIIHLARFQKGKYLNQKINKTVTFPNQFNITIKQKQMYQYKLIGSIHHHGTLNNGHFYAEIQYEDGKWYKISDQIVIPIQISNNNKSSSVYILFFRKLD